jgi:hypothetical protein
MHKDRGRSKKGPKQRACLDPKWQQFVRGVKRGSQAAAIAKDGEEQKAG